MFSMEKKSTFIRRSISKHSKTAIIYEKEIHNQK